MTSTAETVLFDLKHQKSFLSPLTDSLDPYMASMHTFQAFTLSVIHSLEMNESGTLELAQNEILKQLYTDFPSFHKPCQFKSWVKDATLKHPQRRTAKQHQYFHVVEVPLQQDRRMCIIDMVISTICELDDWRDRTYTPSNLVKDPDILYFFGHTNGLKNASFDDSNGNGNGNGNTFAIEDDIIQYGDACVICTNAFHPETNIPQKAPCGHISCATCFRSWLQESRVNRSYTCPHYRGCLVCGKNRCNDHELPCEPMVPVSLTSILDEVLLGRSGMELHGITAERYWMLRECTRSVRVALAVVRRTVGRMEGRWNLVSLTGMEKQHMHKIRGQIVIAAL